MFAPLGSSLAFRCLTADLPAPLALRSAFPASEYYGGSARPRLPASRQSDEPASSRLCGLSGPEVTQVDDGRPAVVVAESPPCTPRASRTPGIPSSRVFRSCGHGTGYGDFRCLLPPGDRLPSTRSQIPTRIHRSAGQLFRLKYVQASPRRDQAGDANRGLSPRSPCRVPAHARYRHWLQPQQAAP
jgi:hypothetical protein